VSESIRLESRPERPRAALNQRLRRWPLPLLAIGVALFCFVIAHGRANVPLIAMLGAVTYMTASRLPRRYSIAAALAALAALTGAFIYLTSSSNHSPLAAEAVSIYLPFGTAWFIGDSVAARRRYLAGLAEQQEREQAAKADRARLEIREERVRIAHELHDVVAHTLAVITVQAGVGRRLMDKRPEEAASALESIETIGRTAQDELRVVVGLLREEGADAALSPAPRLTDLKELVDTVRASGTAVKLRMSSTDQPLSPALELSLYRVVQEALTNVVKHAPRARATVDVAVGERSIRVEVTDDGGTGAAPAAMPGPPGHGIAGMRERVAAFGGSLVAGPRHSAAGGGFQVIADVPLDGAR
jgi:signal transduction histidine kinase